MKQLLICLFAFFTVPLWANSYSTSFSATENPISEGGKWVNGGTTGLDWTNVRTTTNKAFGTMTSQSAQYGDTTAVLTGTWTSTQTAQATIFITSAPSGSNVYTEVEIRLRSTVTAHSSTGYEINCSVASGQSYIQIVRWNGPLGSFTELGSTGGTCVNGDVLKATASGNTITAYRNGNKVLSVTDSTFSNGSPGIGFFAQGNFSFDANYGFSAFSASDNGTTATPDPPTGLTTVVK